MIPDLHRKGLSSYFLLTLIRSHKNENCCTSQTSENTPDFARILESGVDHMCMYYSLCRLIPFTKVIHNARQVAT